MNTSTPKEAYNTIVKAGKDAILVDVRTPQEYASGHAVGAKNIPLQEVGCQASAFTSFKDAYLLCQSGGRSAIGVQLLEPLVPKTTFHNIEGGTSAWTAAGLPIEK